MPPIATQSTPRASNSRPSAWAADARQVPHRLHRRRRLGHSRRRGCAQGTLATNLTSLGQGLQVFSQSLGAEWNNTVVVVLSEFGRTFRENGNRGTDHGHGTVYWVLGGAINGGMIAGEQQPVSRRTLFQDRDYPVLNDYRAVWAACSARCGV
jgi:uncharacterized protein (DUF1501 family)